MASLSLLAIWDSSAGPWASPYPNECQSPLCQAAGPSQTAHFNALDNHTRWGPDIQTHSIAFPLPSPALVLYCRWIRLVLVLSHRNALLLLLFSLYFVFFVASYPVFSFLPPFESPLIQWFSMSKPPPLKRVWINRSVFDSVSVWGWGRWAVRNLRAHSFSYRKGAEMNWCSSHRTVVQRFQVPIIWEKCSS